MRVLWITNGPIISKHREMMGIGAAQSGGWLVAAYDSLKDSDEIELGVTATYVGEDIKESSDGKHKFYLVPCKHNSLDYNPDLPENLSAWKEVIGRFHPDIIHIWGTEFAYGTCALKAVSGIPSVVYMQGLMSQIANHADGQMTFIEKLQSTTIKDILNKGTYWNQDKIYQKRAKIEKELLSHISGVIVENEWCADNCKLLSGGCATYKSLLPINKTFAEHNWTYENCNPHTIFTTAGPNPIKGHHMLLRALSIVKDRYPDVKLMIPGANYYFGKSLSRRLKRESFHKYLLTLLKRFNLQENVSFIGRLSQEEMAKQMETCNIFVMPSAIENHSSTLIEAMMVGTPTISSNVGGISDYYKDGENGLFYRFDEPEVLASLIIRLFENPKEAQGIGAKAKQDVRNARMNINLQSDFEHCYCSLVK